jgi:hypothetical protein
MALNLDKDFDKFHDEKVIKKFLEHSLPLGETLYYYNTLVDINGNILGKLFELNSEYYSRNRKRKKMAYRIDERIVGEVYKIKNIITGKVYIGESIDVVMRKNTHVRDLYSGWHSNRLMQFDFYAYGISAFTFEIIEQVKRKDSLSQREKYWVKEYDSEFPNGYNMPKSRKEYSQSEEYLFIKKYFCSSDENKILMVKSLRNEHRGSRKQ